MPDLTIRFDCANANSRAEEFQHHLISQKIISAGVPLEAHESEVWLNIPAIQGKTVKRVEEEARPWCLDRGLSLMQSTDEPGTSQAAVLMIADLIRVVD